MSGMKYALVDVGSNTIRMSVYETRGATFRLLFSKKEMAGLNNYIDGGKMSEEGIDKACRVLLQFKELAANFEIKIVQVFATASLRNIENSEEASQTIWKRTGLRCEVISGEEESRLGCIGALSGFELREGAVFDIGGGSVEIAGIKDGKPYGMQSLPLGSLALFNAHVEKIIPKNAELEAIHKDVKAVLSRAVLPQRKGNTVCGIGGSARAVLKLSNKILGLEEHNRMLTVSELEESAEVLLKEDKKARLLILKNCPDRLHTIIPGLVLMLDLCRALGCRVLYVSPYGVREGYLCSRLGLSNETAGQVAH